MGLAILGAHSMLGWAIFNRVPEARAFCSAGTRCPPGSGLVPLDLTDPTAVAQAVAGAELVIHCGAVCRVDKCERYPDFARAINVDGTANVLRALEPGCRLVYCSSDHVFGGDSGPYDEHSSPCPISYYGRTRVEAEGLVLQRRGALVVRAPLCVGSSYNGRSGHLDWLRYRQGKGLPMTIVEDEFRSAVWSAQAAERVLELAASKHQGLRHLWATRAVSRPELARYLNQRFQLGAFFELEGRRQRPAPHLGRVELRSVYDDRLAAPLPSVVT